MFRINAHMKGGIKNFFFLLKRVIESSIFETMVSRVFFVEDKVCYVIAVKLPFEGEHAPL